MVTIVGPRSKAEQVDPVVQGAHAPPRPSRPPTETVGSAVAVACGAQLLNAVNIGACPLMLPAITGSLGGQADTPVWLVASYAIVFGGLVLWGGKIGDSHGIGRVLPLGFLVSVAGSLVAVVAPDAMVLVAAWVLQGVGAALAVPNGMAWLTSSTDDPRVRSRRLSWFAGSGAIGFAVGALMGGVLSDRLSCRAVFGAECLVALVLGVLALRSAPRRTTRTRRPVPRGAFATSTALALAVLALYAGPRSGWLHPSTLAVAAVAAWRERVSPDPMIPLHVWRISGLWGVLASTALLCAAWAAGPARGRRLPRGAPARRDRAGAGFVSQNDLVVTLPGPAHAGIAGGPFTAASQVGGGLGLAVLAVVAAGAAPGRDASGHFPEVFWAAALVAAVLALLVVVGRARTAATGVSTAVGPVIDTTKGR
ncbi:MFS transporter [Pseudonocardia sp. RS010]|uniref:MFS transporter n=1 Tax=Pseudonocardia sp. RS010 TaxID=3385979 RepID=UPI0039A101FE